MSWIPWIQIENDDTSKEEVELVCPPMLKGEIDAMKKEIFRENVFIITGASSGIGEELALQLADHGAWLTLAARTAEKLQKVAEECIQRGGRAVAIPTDVSDQSQCKKLIDSAIEEYGRIDTLINNASIAAAASFYEYQDLAVFEKSVQINFMGSVFCTFYALPYLKETRGRLVGVSSMAGKCPTAKASGYNSSKAAVTGFYNSLRQELVGSGVTVTGIYPGFINTGITGRAITASGDKTGKQMAQEANGMPVETCVRLIIKAVEKRKREAIIPAWCKILPWMNLIAPRTFEKITQKSRKVD